MLASASPGTLRSLAVKFGEEAAPRAGDTAICDAWS